ncbi:MAG: hypothetical protein H6622_00975 [Halobacteriovoraceae bacterium]|nr:hypothetical protein [Halobacteriovoraceae bacterium]
MKPFILYSLVIGLISCQKQMNTQIEKELICELKEGKYSIQNLTLMKDKQSYEAILIGAPSCLKVPHEIQKLELARINEESREKAYIEYSDGKYKAFISEEFKIAVKQFDSKTNETKEVGSWGPFISGAAGAVTGSIVGNVLADKLLSKKSDEISVKSAAPIYSPTPVNNLKEVPTQNQKKGSFFKTKSKSSGVKIFQRRKKF